MSEGKVIEATEASTPQAGRTVTAVGETGPLDTPIQKSESLQKKPHKSVSSPTLHDKWPNVIYNGKYPKELVMALLSESID